VNNTMEVAMEEAVLVSKLANMVIARFGDR